MNKPFHMSGRNLVKVLRNVALVVALAPAVKLSAATLTVVHTFGGADGWRPLAGLVQGIDTNFYGTTHGGGTDTNCPGGCGTIFRITPAGNLTTLHGFGRAYQYNGLYPDAWGLVQGIDSNFYGTTASGGYLLSDGQTYGANVYKIDSSGTYTDLCDFGFIELCEAGLIQGSDGSFYGTTPTAGNGSGTVFQVTSTGALTGIYAFTGGADGGIPFAGLVQGSDGNFYGTTYNGGSFNGTNYWGTVYKVTVGGAFTTLYRFTDGTDGGYPAAGLVQGNDGNFYGTTQHGGTGHVGTVFRITSAGALTTLHSFSGPDGAQPGAALVQASDGNLYGTTMGGGTNGPYGTIFKITTAGAFASVYQFSGYADGANPRAPLFQGMDGSLYGTAQFGGTNSVGTVFRLTLP